MPSNGLIRKYLQAPYGLDLRSSAQQRSPLLATSMKNVDVRESDDGDYVTARSGFKAIDELSESAGLLAFQAANTVLLDRTLESFIINVGNAGGGSDDQIDRVTTGTATFSYTDVSTGCT